MLLSWQSHSVRVLNYQAISRWVQAETSCRLANRWDGQPLYFRFVCITWSFCVFQWPMGNRLDDVILARCKMFKQTVYWRLSLKKLILEQNFIIRLPIQRTLDTPWSKSLLFCVVIGWLGLSIKPFHQLLPMATDASLRFYFVNNYRHDIIYRRFKFNFYLKKFKLSSFY